MCAFYSLLSEIDVYQRLVSAWSAKNFKGSYRCRDLVVIGDSLYEMVAGQTVRDIFSDLRVKLVKLKEQLNAT